MATLSYQTPWERAYPERRCDLRTRAVVLLGPRSHLGGVYGPLIVERCSNVIAVVDDCFRDKRIHGVVRWTSAEFRSRAPAIPGLVGVAMAGSLLDHTTSARLLRECGVERADLVDVLDEVTYIKMEMEGFEQKALRGATRLIRECRPRMAITAYHYADDLLDLWRLFEELAPDYELRLRHHSSYYYDTIFYAAPAEQGRVA